MIIDELVLHLKELLLGKDPRFTPLILDRFFRILAEGKELLSLGSDGEFVLSLTLFKMMEALSIREIDEMIRTLQKELSGVAASASASESPSAPVASRTAATFSTPASIQPAEAPKAEENASAIPV